jgi:hypothetical protein
MPRALDRRAVVTLRRPGHFLPLKVKEALAERGEGG